MDGVTSLPCYRYAGLGWPAGRVSVGAGGTGKAAGPSLPGKPALAGEASARRRLDRADWADLRRRELGTPALQSGNPSGIFALLIYYAA